MRCSCGGGEPELGRHREEHRIEGWVHRGREDAVGGRADRGEVPERVEEALAVGDQAGLRAGRRTRRRGRASGCATSRDRRRTRCATRPPPVRSARGEPGIAESHPRRRTLVVGPLCTAARGGMLPVARRPWHTLEHPARTRRPPWGDGTGSHALRRPARSRWAARRPAGAPRRPAGRGRRRDRAGAVRGVGVGAHLGYQPALDGIRAFAVAAVLFYHAGQSWAVGGFLGVDTFFVLSGFLITTLLVTEFTSRGGIDLLAFWVRRARRLLPALFLVMVGIVDLRRGVRGARRGRTHPRRLALRRWATSRTGGSSSRASRTSTSSHSRRPCGTCGRWRSRSSSTWSGR